MATVIESLVTTLGFDIDTKELSKFDGILTDTVKTLTALTASAIAGGTAMFAFSKNLAESNDELGKFSDRIGISLSSLQEFGFVSELSGGSIDSINSSLQNLTRISSEAAKGIGGGVEAFGLLGISVTDSNGLLKSTEDIFLDVADGISGLSTQAEKLELSSKLGISDDLILTLEQGSEAISAQRQEARELGFIIDRDATSAAANFNDQLLKVGRILKGVSNAIGTRLIKQFTPMLEVFVAWFKINKKIIKQNISAFFDRLKIGLQVIINVAKRVAWVFLQLVNALGGWENSLKAATLALVALNANALKTPILILATVSALFLLIEDVIKFAKGGDSALGALTEKFPMIQAALRAVIDLIAMVGEGWRLIFTQGGEALEGFLLVLSDVNKKITDFFVLPLQKGFDIFNKTSKITTPKIKTPDLSAQAPGFFDFFTFANLPGLRFAAQSDKNTSTSNIAALPQNNTTNVSNKTGTTNVFNINALNPEEFKTTVKSILAEEYSGAQTNLESQVRS